MLFVAVVIVCACSSCLGVARHEGKSPRRFWRERRGFLGRERIQDLWRRWNVVRALNGVTVDTAPGEVLAIFGPSGSGKTTFLMIAGLIDVPSQRQSWYRGETSRRRATELNKSAQIPAPHIGFVFQRSNLIPFLSAVENVQVAMQLCGGPQAAGARAWLLVLAGLGLITALTLLASAALRR